MKRFISIILILFTVSSCVIRPGYYTGYTPTFTPTITPIIPTYNPYLYRPFPTYNYYRPYNYYYNPRPRTNVIINPPSYQNNNNHNHSGPRGGRRK